MKRKKSKKVKASIRLDATTNIDEASSLLGGDYSGLLQRKPRSSKEWEYIDHKELETLNLEKYNYRATEDYPAIWIDPSSPDEVQCNDGSINLDLANRILKLAHKCKANKKQLVFRSPDSSLRDDDGNEIGPDAPTDDSLDYSFAVFKNGNVKVGCQDFDYAELVEFEKTFSSWL